MDLQIDLSGREVEVVQEGSGETYHYGCSREWCTVRSRPVLEIHVEKRDKRVVGVRPPERKGTQDPGPDHGPCVFHGYLMPTFPKRSVFVLPL